MPEPLAPTVPHVTIHRYDFVMQDTGDGDTVDVELARDHETVFCEPIPEFTGEHDGTPVFVQRESPVRQAVKAIRAEYLRFEDGTAWASDPDGSQDLDLTTGSRRETTAHLSGFTPTQVRAIRKIVGS
jgi:hypothetical protein